MKKRLITAIIMIAIVTGILGLSSTVFPFAFDILVLGATVVASIEVTNLFDKSGRPSYKIASCIFAVYAFAATLFCVLMGYNALVLFLSFIGGMLVLFLVTWIIPLLFIKSAVKDNPFRVATGMSINGFSVYRAMNTLTIAIYPTFLSFFMYFLNHITELGFANITTRFAGKQIALFSILLVIVITCLTDTMAYCVGSLLKGPKLCPKISPNKTISGAIGGIVGGIVGAVVLLAIFRAILPVYSYIKYWQIVIVGFFGSIVSQCGDLFESYLKRRAQVKDSGNILPGHGGVMDRIDAMLFNVPFIFVCMILILA